MMQVSCVMMQVSCVMMLTSAQLQRAKRFFLLKIKTITQNNKQNIFLNYAIVDYRHVGLYCTPSTPDAIIYATIKVYSQFLYKLEQNERTRS